MRGEVDEAGAASISALSFLVAVASQFILGEYFARRSGSTETVEGSRSRVNSLDFGPLGLLARSAAGNRAEVLAWCPLRWAGGTPPPSAFVRQRFGTSAAGDVRALDALPWRS